MMHIEMWHYMPHACRCLKPMNKYFADLQWRNSQDFAVDNYMMPMGPSAYNPIWTGMQQPGMEGYMAPYAAPMPYMGYGLGPLDMPFGGFVPQDPFGANCMYPVGPPQRYAGIMYFSMYVRSFHLSTSACWLFLLSLNTLHSLTFECGEGVRSENGSGRSSLACFVTCLLFTFQTMLY